MSPQNSFLVGAVLAYLGVVAAAPQILDFAQITAAPTLASGPTDNGLVNQTASLVTTFASPTAVTIVSTAAVKARDDEISKRDAMITYSQTWSSYNGWFGQSSVNTNFTPGVLFWLNGGGYHTWYGNFDNAGSIIMSQTSMLAQNPKGGGGQVITWSGHDAYNGNLINRAGALIQANDIGSNGAPSYQWGIRSLLNNGTIQMCGRGDTCGSTFQISSDQDSINNGLISYEQSLNNYGTNFAWKSTLQIGTGGVGSNIYNNGAFRLINTLFQNVQNVYGNGCWQLGKGSVLYLLSGTGIYQNPSSGPSFPGQSISFQDSTAVLHMDSGVYSKSSNFGATLYGFTAGNALEFSELIWTYSYCATTGVLTVKMWSGNVVNIQLGLGYAANAFYSAWNFSKYSYLGYNAIFYKYSAPSQTSPAQCAISTPVCQNLVSVPPVAPVVSATGYVTMTSTGPVGGSLTTTTVQPSATVSGTKIVITPSAASFVTTTSTASQGAALTTTTISPSGIAPGTVIVVTTLPASFVTSTSTASYGAPTTTTIVSPSGSVPGTIIVVSPSSATITSTTSTTSAYAPYYPALATGYTSDPALAATATTTAGQACPTTPEAGTYCGFINPEDPCAPQPDGYGPVPSPDTASAFLSYSAFQSMATSAPTVIASTSNAQYVQTFSDLTGSSSAQSYLGLITLQSYDVQGCAAACDAKSLCTAFNIFVQRDPSLNPSTNATSYGIPTVWGDECPNPPSMTSFKCTLWGSELDASTATNQGQWRLEFDVVIAASNGYDKTNSSTPVIPAGSFITVSSSTTSSTSSYPSTGFVTLASPTSSTSSVVKSSSSTTPSAASTSTTSSACTVSAPTNCHGQAISAPQHWLGSKFFPGPFNAVVCSQYALLQNLANKQAALNAGSSSYSKCQMFNSYYIHKNGAPAGTVCSLYDTALDTSYATYGGGYSSSGDHYQCRQSWTWAMQS